MWNVLPNRIAAIACCAVALGACSDITAPEMASPAPEIRSAAQAPAANIEFGDFALHVPANVPHVRGILLTLGGPNTKGFAIGTPFGAPLPAVEQALQDLGARFRDLAAERGLAILGSSSFGPTAYPNTPESDQQLLDAIAEAATLTGRNELVDAPLLVYGSSGGGPEATGFTQRNPARVTGLFLKVPLSAGPLTGEALRIPAYMVLAEQDVFVDNPTLMQTFAVHRAAGAPWAMALELGVPHFSLSVAQRELTIDWMRAVLPLGNAGPFRQTAPQVGFIGDPVTGAIVPAHAFAGDASTVSWFPKRPLATQWAAFIGM